ncbi:hypothetical protein VKT23_011431 [Stygiomarasmius scandens]|uniref:Uncharacterized protein n=1 Tax=Marasmiellus scandens TaxID=2682957 RepID=A0ABR1JCV8_9AGAR
MQFGTRHRYLRGKLRELEPMLVTLSEVSDAREVNGILSAESQERVQRLRYWLDTLRQEIEAIERMPQSTALGDVHVGAGTFSFSSSSKGIETVGTSGFGVGEIFGLADNSNHREICLSACLSESVKDEPNGERTRNIRDSDCQSRTCCLNLNGFASTSVFCATLLLMIAMRWWLRA